MFAVLCGHCGQEKLSRSRQHFSHNTEHSVAGEGVLPGGISSPCSQVIWQQKRDHRWRPNTSWHLPAPDRGSGGSAAKWPVAMALGQTLRTLPVREVSLKEAFGGIPTVNLSLGPGSLRCVCWGCFQWVFYVVRIIPVTEWWNYHRDANV